MNHELAAHLIAEGAPTGGIQAAVTGIVLAIIGAISAIVVARIQRGKTPPVDPNGPITVPRDYIAGLIKDRDDEEAKAIAADYRVGVLRRGIRELREWVIRNSSTDPDTIIDDEVRRNL